MIYMNVMPDASEVTHYNCCDIPVYIQWDDLSYYPDMKGLCHWHKDIEIVYVTDGEMNYHINGKTVHLKEQDCVIINSQQLHYGSSRYRRDCRFICIRFHPKILNTDLSVYQKYVVPLIENNEIDYLSYNKGSLNYQTIEKLVKDMLCIKTEKTEGFELRLIGILHLLWYTLFQQCKSNLLQESIHKHNDLTLQKKMVSYIYEHYQDDLSLDEISASANISRSKCCIIFKQYLQQSPIDFLNKYRLEVSRCLLLNTQSSITQIAFSCGFNHLSYFSKTFLKEYGCTPTEYRKRSTMPL